MEFRSLCVYCGSSNRGPHGHRDAAVRLGRILAAHRIRLVYGGGRVGVMGTIANAVLEAGGEVIGIIPRFLEAHEVAHGNVTRLEIVDSMHERKARMASLADGFVILPGGLGTLDELFEILTWKQLGLHDKPIVVVDLHGYWRRLRELVEAMVTDGYVRSEHLDLLRFVSSVDSVLPALAEMPTAGLPVPSKWL
ncbi:MAG: TIGR00730 family Rossman fold protein [Alphaproteobacteria bacterium]